MTRRLAGVFLAFFTGSILLQGAARADRFPARVAPPTQDSSPGRETYKLPDGTRVSLRFAQRVSPAEAKVDDPVRLRVAANVRVQGLVVIPEGAEATGRVVEVKQPHSLGRGSLLAVRVEEVRSVTGGILPLRAMEKYRGGGQGKMVGKVFIPPLAGNTDLTPLDAVGSLLWPLNLTQLASKGDAKNVEEGTRLVGRVQGDVLLDRAAIERVQPQPPSPNVRVTVFRPDDNLVMYRPWVEVNGVRQAHLARRRYFVLDLEPGPQAFSASGQKPVRFDFVAGEHYFVKVHYRIGATGLMAALWGITLADRAEGEDEVGQAHAVESKDRPAKRLPLLGQLMQ
jgi:hypothetical protein